MVLHVLNFSILSFPSNNMKVINEIFIITILGAHWERSRLLSQNDPTRTPRPNEPGPSISPVFFDRLLQPHVSKK